MAVAITNVGPTEDVNNPDCCNAEVIAARSDPCNPVTVNIASKGEGIGDANPGALSVVWFACCRFVRNSSTPPASFIASPIIATKSGSMPSVSIEPIPSCTRLAINCCDRSASMPPMVSPPVNAGSLNIKSSSIAMKPLSSSDPSASGVVLAPIRAKFNSLMSS